MKPQLMKVNDPPHASMTLYRGQALYRGKALSPREPAEGNTEVPQHNRNRNRISTTMKRLLQSLTATITIATLMVIVATERAPAQRGDLILNPNGSAGYFSLILLGGAGYQSHTGSFTLSEEEIECCNFDGGSGFGPSLALRTEYTPDPEGRLRFAARIGLSSETAHFLSEPEALPVLGEDHRPQEGLFQNKLTVGRRSLDISPMVMVKILDADLYLTFGGTWSRTLASTTDLQERILAPIGLTFLDGTTAKDRPDLPVALVADNHTSLVGGLDLRYPITDRIGLAAELHYTHGVTGFGVEESWKASGVSGGVGVEWRMQN